MGIMRVISKAYAALVIFKRHHTSGSYIVMFIYRNVTQWTTHLRCKLLSSGVRWQKITPKNFRVILPFIFTGHCGVKLAIYFLILLLLCGWQKSRRRYIYIGFLVNFDRTINNLMLIGFKDYYSKVIEFRLRIANCEWIDFVAWQVEHTFYNVR